MGKAKRTVTCSVCGAKGHNRRTCPENQVVPMEDEASPQPAEDVVHIIPSPVIPSPVIPSSAELLEVSSHERSMINTPRRTSSSPVREVLVCGVCREVSVAECPYGHNLCKEHISVALHTQCPLCSPSTQVLSPSEREYCLVDPCQEEGEALCNKGHLLCFGHFFQALKTGCLVCIANIDNASEGSLHPDSPLPSEGDDGSEGNARVCGICHRNSTDLYNIDLYPLTLDTDFEGKLRRRNFGDRSGMVSGCLVCTLCQRYVCASDKAQALSPRWGNAWPAVFWTCLSRPNFIDPAKMMSFLPETLRDCWRLSRADWLQTMRDADDTTLYDFTDVTHDRKKFEADIDTGNLGLMMAALNEHPFPEIRCPAGCFLYIDDALDEKIQLIPGCHYLAKLKPKFTSFNACSSHFAHCRPDWPTLILQLDWEVSPAIIVDDVLGLCIISCSKQVHSDMKHQWIHVPSQPVMGNMSDLQPDDLAPAIVCSNFVRPGVMKSNTASFPVYEQRGDSGGLSTFRLGVRPSRSLPPMSERVAASTGLVLTEREDIRDYILQHEDYGPKYINTMLHSYTITQESTERRVASCSETGTFIQLDNAYDLLMANSLKSADAQGNEGKVNPYDCMIIVHPNTATGHAPFGIPCKKSQNMDDNLKNAAASLSLVALMHSPDLHRTLFPSNQVNQLPAHQDELRTALTRSCVYYNKEHGKITWSAKMTDLANIISRNVDRVGADVHQHVASMFSTVCSQVQVLDITDMDVTDVESILEESTNTVFILTRPQRHRRYCFPEQISGADLVLAATCQVSSNHYKVDASFRWTARHAWQTFPDTSDQVNEAGSMNLLIYVKKTSNTSAVESMLKSCGGQTLIKCEVHDKYLIREGVGSLETCCVESCNTPVRWRCPHLQQYQCAVGLCLKHYKNKTQNADATGVLLVQQKEGYETRNLQTQDDSPADSSDDDDGLDIYEPDDSEDGTHEDLDRYTVGLEFEDDRIPIATSSNNTPTYVESRFPSAAGHYLLNNFLQVKRSYGKSNVPIALQTLLQNICSQSPNWSCPLLYPEAHLFPQIFWTMNGDSIVGALPSIWYSGTLERHVAKPANLQDHMFVRLMDSSLLTSHDYGYLQYMFDINLNGDLNANSALIACRKGLEHLTRGRSGYQPESRENHLKFDEVDSRREVNRLSALLRSEGTWTYFITLTCNDERTFGVWPIRQAIRERYPDDEANAVQNYAVILCRAWERTVRYMWNYIQHSPERPLGHVKSAWMRFEFQNAGSPGNRPHVHGGITLHTEDQDTTLERIACETSSMWHEDVGTDYKSLREAGIVSNYDEWVDLYLFSMKIQVHDCRNAGERCMKRNADGELKCRVQRHPPSFVYTFDANEDLYDNDTLQRLAYLDLATLDESGRIVPDKRFIGGRWRYPAQPHETFIPTVPILFASLQSATNVQVCDKKFMVSYMAKYAAGVDEKRRVTFKPSKEDDNSVVGQIHDLYNVKISGQAIRNKMKTKLVREMPLTEMIWYSARLPYVVCDCDMTHAQTQPPEYRSAFLKRGHRQTRTDGGHGEPTAVVDRRELPESRQFTEFQQLAIEDIEQSNYYVDITSRFSIRPPELRIFNLLELYLKFFCFSPATGKENVAGDLTASPWIDGNKKRVRLRQAHVMDAAIYVQTSVEENPDNETFKELFETIFYPLAMEFLKRQDADVPLSDLYKLFVDGSKVKRNVVVFTSITPTNISRFLVHLLLTTGSFDTELELYGSPNMLAAFHKACLIPNDPTEDDVRQLARHYVLDQLQWLPITVRPFSRALQSLIEGLQRFLLDQEIVYDGMPLATERQMEEAASVELEELQVMRRNAAVDALAAEDIPNFPPTENLKSFEPVDYDPIVLRAPGQSDESLLEQQDALQHCVDAIDSLFAPDSTFVSSRILIGPPGCGKTHLLLIAQTYALSKGLTCQLAAITSERARRLGGEHLHLLFSLPVYDNANYSVKLLAERTILNLCKNPIQMAALQRISILFIEEIGLVSAETFAVMDLVLRSVRNRNMPLGGLVVIASGDPRQLPPVEGKPIWSSHHFLTTFSVKLLHHQVRARADQDLVKVNNILRQSENTDEDVETFIEILNRRCLTRCVDSWDRIPPDVMRIVGTRKAQQTIIENFLQQKRNDPATIYQEYESDDRVESNPGTWAPANNTTRNALDRHCLEKRTLFIFVGAMMRLTYNNVRATPNLPRFSQGQLCLVTSLTPEGDQQDQKLTVKLIPPGIRTINVDTLPEDCVEFRLGRRDSRIVSVGRGMSKAKRHQFPLAYYVSSTVHKAIGETCPAVATQISITNKEFRLWEREQLLVVVSRVTNLDNLIFVADNPQDTINAMVQLLQQRSRWAKHIDNILHVMDANVQGPRILRHTFNPIPGRQRPIPALDLGYVYLIISTKYPRSGYVGETGNIRRRLAEHNSGHGSEFTRSPHLRPWALMVLVHGFHRQHEDDRDHAARKEFERHWHGRNGRISLCDSRQVYRNGQELFETWRHRHPELIWEEYGTIRSEVEV